jgi:hypothetical protein
MFIYLSLKVIFQTSNLEVKVLDWVKTLCSGIHSECLLLRVKVWDRVKITNTK